MDDPEIWNAIHRISVVLENIHARRGVEFDGILDDAKKLAISQLMKAYESAKTAFEKNPKNATLKRAYELAKDAFEKAGGKP